ncbi:MAG: phosphate signaling complex protein PhoU [Verrucomicrobiales bacterium]|nr:phosphate signaling complex protein PhoU [Verrucomicrobiales bacterium]
MTHFEADIRGLRERLLTMASLASTAVRQAVKAMIDRDDDLANKVEDEDTALDTLEKDVDEVAVLLLLRAPLARDLRLIMVATKISHDLERVGDEATAIARRARELNREPLLKPYVDLPRMANMVLEMLETAISAFVDSNSERARAVIPRDKEVDLLNKQLHRELTSFIAENPANISRCLNLMAISKRLERIGDHAKNIAEEVVYFSEAQDIRHTQPNPDASGAPAAP